jgi:predicted secreted protein
MNEVKFDIKTVITIITAAIVFGGFYYTTQHRLDHLEAKISDLEIEITKAKKRKSRK